MQNKWLIEAYLGDHDSSLQRISLSSFPASVGRDASLAVAILRSEVSRHHAEFFEEHGMLFLRDLGSTNGTYINRAKVEAACEVKHGDIIHFASYEVRLIEDNRQKSAPRVDMTIMNALPLSNKLPVGLAKLQQLLDERAINAQFQPIVSPNGQLYGYEVLGRGSRADLPISPLELFHIAESMPGKDAELSLLMRDCGVEQAAKQSQQHKLFMNTHPAELRDIPKLLWSLKRLRNNFPDIPMVLEIHEDAVTDIAQMKALASELACLNMELAYDDFGAGQARLMEMIDVPVKYVKFDIALIRGLPTAPEAKRQMVSALASMTKSMGINALAEGVETIEELELCKAMGFDLIQGYYFGKPANILDYDKPLK